MKSQIPFTGGCGRLLQASLDAAAVDKHQAFITNVVHCHPPNNRDTFLHEKQNCRPYLQLELAIVEPKLVIGLGKDAEHALRLEYPDAVNDSLVLDWPFRPPRQAAVGSSPYLLFAPHPGGLRWKPKEIRDEFVRR